MKVMAVEEEVAQPCCCIPLRLREWMLKKVIRLTSLLILRE